jgi:hypothetical protein
MNGTFIRKDPDFGKNTALFVGTQTSSASNNSIINMKVNMELWWNDMDGENRITIGPVYKDIGSRDTSSIASDILRYQLIPHC